MSQPAKRKAEHAFVEDAGLAQKPSKKQRKRRKDRRGSDAQQLQTEAHEREGAADVDPVPARSSAANSAPATTAPNVSPPNDSTQSTKPKKKRPHGENLTEHGEGVLANILAQGEGEPQGVASIRKKKNKKKHRGESTVGPVKTEGATMPDVPQPSEEASRRASKKKEKKNKKKTRSRARREEEDGGVGIKQTTRGQDLISNLPLEDRIEPPSVAAITNVEDPEIESEEQDSDPEAEQGAELEGRIPLADRIEAPPKPKKHQKGWSVSPAMGGSFIDHDPILTADNEHLILPTRSDVRIYSQSTSLLVRKLQPRLKDEDDHIVACVKAAARPANILVATHSGDLSLWDWSQGEQIWRWKYKRGLGHIESLSSTTKLQRVLAVHGGPDASHTAISILDLEQNSSHPAATADLLDRKGLKFYTSFFADTGVIVASTRKHLLLGYCPGFASEDQHPSFYWRELKVPSEIVSFDARSVTEHRAGNTPRVDAAVGLKSGEIMLYEDLLFKLIGKEKKTATVDISARILHWHRAAVSSVKWSRDGNYLISGGTETVLVIWNLDTNQQQYLPHLSSEILNISVSPQGSSYALRLSDNSVMVLSTANLEAATNVSGFASQHNPETPLAVSLHPVSPDRLLVAVPKNVLKVDQAATALQTYDLNTDRELGRQALTRNSTTVVTTQSGGSSNLEPNVTHICLSADGKWLATVEEWHADPQDLDGVTLTSEDDVDEFGAETCLKIWLYNEQQSEWELLNRIDNPHSRGSIKVLALESSPSRNEFATAGEDGKVKIWRPRARVRDGVPVRNESGEQLYNWSQTAVIPCSISHPATNSAALAYSPDGTVIATSWSQSSPLPRWTYLIDSDNGKICHSAPNLVSHGLASMVFSDHYLVSLSDSICIYDTVSGSTISKTRLESKYLDQNRRGYVAANILDGTVAIAVNPTNGNGPGKLAIIDVKKLEWSPLFEEEIPSQIHALLASPSMQGYVVIDGNSNISRVRRAGKNAVQATTPAGDIREPEDVRRGLDRIFGQVQPPPALDSAHGVGGRSLMAGDERATNRSLEDVLNFQTSAEAPGVGELFERIAGLFARPAVAVS